MHASGQFVVRWFEENATLFCCDVDGVNQVMRLFLELFDVGIMGHCDSGEYCRRVGIDC